MIDIDGVEEIIERWDTSIRKFQTTKMDAMSQSLDEVHKAVPPYPPPPAGSKYKRTERLGRSLGSGFGGGSSGTPDILEVHLGSGFIEGKIGTRLYYGEYVIGEGTQAAIHAGRWWTNLKWAEKAAEKVGAVWVAAMDKLAEWMNG